MGSVSCHHTVLELIASRKPKARCCFVVCCISDFLALLHGAASSECMRSCANLPLLVQLIINFVRGGLVQPGARYRETNYFLLSRDTSSRKLGNTNKTILMLRELAFAFRSPGSSRGPCWKSGRCRRKFGFLRWRRVRASHSWRSCACPRKLLHALGQIVVDVVWARSLGECFHE